MMTTRDDENIVLASDWWESKRLRYNVGLVVAGILAFICYAMIASIFKGKLPDAETTVFTTIFQGVGYLFMMGVANILYFLGAFSEKIVRPKNVNAYRKLIFNLGFWFSVVLPFSIPIFLVYLLIFHPEALSFVHYGIVCALWSPSK